MSMRPIVYISGPITLGDRNWNVYQAFDAQRKLMDAGFSTINPMASTCFPFAWERGYDADVWMDCDYPLVAASAAVLRLPGESAGADLEVAYATDANIRVYHDLEQLVSDRDKLFAPSEGRRELQHLSWSIGEWSDEVFGHSRDDGDQAGLPALHHLREEIDELIDNPSDESEWADVLMLLLDAARRRDIPVWRLLQATRDKLAVNKRRKWGKPDENGVVHHVSDDTAREEQS